MFHLPQYSHLVEAQSPLAIFCLGRVGGASVAPCLYIGVMGGCGVLRVAVLTRRGSGRELNEDRVVGGDNRG